MKKKILILCPYPPNTAPSQRFKFEQYLNYLRENGYDYSFSSFYSNHYNYVFFEKKNLFLKIILTVYGLLKRLLLIIKIPFYDGIFVSLHITPFFKIIDYIYFFLAKKIIYDIDDAIFIPSSKNSLTNYFNLKKKIDFYIKNSNHVITCTPYLFNRAKKLNKNVTDISSTIDLKVYKTTKKSSKKNKIIIGWTGSFSTTKYIFIIKNILLDIKKKYNCDIHIVGGDKNKLNVDEFYYIKWDSKTEVTNISKFDIGIYPLKLDKWSLGKSGLKALQCMSLGIPVVATNIGATKRVLRHNKEGFLIDRNNKKKWFYYLEKLIIDIKLRKKMGFKAKSRVKKYFSFESNKNTYLDIFKKVYD